MRSTPSTSAATPPWLMICLVSGLASGVAAALGLVLGLTLSAKDPVAPSLPLAPAGVSTELFPAGPTEEWLTAIRDLTAVMERRGLQPLPSATAGRTQLDGGPEDSLATLAETLAALNKSLERLNARPLGVPGVPAPFIEESMRSQPVRATEVTAMVEGLRGDEGPSLQRSLYLRPIEDVVDRFGMPTGVSARNAGLFATWATGDHSLQIQFVNGVVATVYN